jgi:hypothetical protein
MAGKLAELESLLQPERKYEARRILTTIASLSEKKREVSLRTEESRERVMAVATTLLGVTATVATALIGSKLFDSVSTSPVASIFGKLFPLMGAVLAFVVVIQVLTTALRIKRRKAVDSPRDTKTDG